MKIFSGVTVFFIFLTLLVSAAEPSSDSSDVKKDTLSNNTQQTILDAKMQPPDTDSTNNKVSDTLVTKDAVIKIEAAASEVSDSSAKNREFVNPFLADDYQKEPGTSVDTSAADTTANRSAGVQKNVQGDFFEENEKKRIDIIVDMGIGMSLPRFNVKPDNISTEGKPQFIFTPGIIIPIGKKFYAGIAFRYLQLAFELNQDFRIIGSDEITYTNINARENLTFITMPLQVGVRFELGPVTPYFYGDVEPAFFSSGHQFSKQARAVYYDDGSKYFDTLNSDIDITKIREQFQVFIGGGIGLEFFYGYGMVYIDGSIQYGLNRVDKPDDFKSLPQRRACTAFYFPISLGVRFYL